MSEAQTALATMPPPDSSLQPATLDQLRAFADTFAVSALLPVHLRNRPADVAITVLYGRELGLTPMQAIQGIFVIEGKPGVSAATAVALVKRSPACEYFRCVETTDKRAVYETKRRGEPEPTRMSFTIEDAARAELLGKGTWKKYPAAMLRNRASMQLARDVYPDVVANVYDPDEVEDVRAPGAVPGMVAPPAPSAPPPAPAGTIEATATPVPAKAPLLERVAKAPSLEALIALAAECKAAAPAEQDSLRTAYASRKAVLANAVTRSTEPALPADGKPVPGWEIGGAQPDPRAGEAPRGQAVREGGRVSMGGAKAGELGDPPRGYQESKTWGDIVDAGAAPVEREVGADDE